MHGNGADVGPLRSLVDTFMRSRESSSPLGRTASAHVLNGLLAGAVTEQGIGAAAAWDLFESAIVPNTMGLGSERFLAFIPVAPTVAAIWMDAAVGAANFSAESWLEASGAVAAENQLLRFLADTAGLPSGAGGCFMSGGSIGNLSALTVARAQVEGRSTIAVADTAHTSILATAAILGLNVVSVPTGADGRLTAPALAAVTRHRSDVGIVAVSAGSTNAGAIDDLAGAADECARIDAWLHVDAAYGGAALLLPELRPAFNGIERADSVIIDPHKWLFATAGSCALIYRDPQPAAEVHAQRGPYIDVFGDDADAWNPSDFGYQLTRRASGLPFWFSLITHGLEAYRQSIRAAVDLAVRCADRLANTPRVSVVMPPQLGVVLFTRQGWQRDDWRRWADDLLRDGIAFVAPSSWRGEPVGRLVFMHPLTPHSIIDELIESLT